MIFAKLRKIDKMLLEPLAQVLIITTVAFSLYFISINYLKSFRNLNPAPSLISNRDLPKRHQIKTGLFINNFLKANFVRSSFEMLGIIWFEFETGVVTLAQLEQMMFSKGDVDGQSDLHAKYQAVQPIVQEHSGRTYVQYPIKLNFISNLDHRLFPFDSHRLYLTMNNMYLNAEQFEFVTHEKDFVVSPNLLIYGWQNIRTSVQVGAASKQVGHQKASIYPRVVYAIDFQRNSFKDIWLLLLPLLVSFFMSMFTFSYDHKEYHSTILSIGLATISAMIGYRFVINNAAPAVPYFMLIDHLFILLLLLAFAVFLLNVFNFFAKYRGLATIGLHLILIFTWTGLLYFWI